MHVDRQIRFEHAKCGRGIFLIRKIMLRIQKYPDTCGGGLVAEPVKKSNSGNF